MPRYIKTAALAGQQEESDAKIRTTVETIIADVGARRRVSSRLSGAVRQMVAVELPAFR